MLGFGVATGVPQALRGLIDLMHPYLVVLACGPGLPEACYADKAIEAVIFIIGLILCVGYGLWTLAVRLNAAQPPPPPGTSYALVEHGDVPVTVPAQMRGVVAAKLDPEVINGGLTQTQLAPPKGTTP